ncbi:hypothetical protein ACLBXM_01210 [Xanthobacteraceae bacterium A53D]
MPASRTSAPGKPATVLPAHAAPPLAQGLVAPEAAVSVTLTHSAALVVFDLLARMMDRHDAEGIRDLLTHPGEVAALWQLMASFEQALVEPKDADYRALITAAREHVVSRMGTAV